MIPDLTELRKQIDETDEKVLRLIKKRFDIALQMAQIKKSEGIRLYQPERDSVSFREKKSCHRTWCF